MLEAEGISAGYAGLRVVDGVSVRVHEGEVVVVLGPNGSGKSTLLKAIFGLLPLMEGRLRVMGRWVEKPEPERLVRMGVGYVPQVDNIFPSLTVRENLEMGGFAAGNGEVEEVLELFPELREKLHLHAINLSGGERQMLALARALMPKPRILLLDEPSAGLAPAMVGRIMGKIEEVRRAGVAVLLVEQNVRSALQIATRGCIMAGGRKVFEGTPAEILSHRDMARIYFGRREA
ncbi:MAG: ABC transporter ATP-binding protein [Euryarchaeota archaeon]|nr:ABC transporter ATP-binding protein [Euryarchaeota archaeon]